MAGTQVQHRRGSTAEHASFTGAAGEITVDVTKKTTVVHDGATPGGFPLAREDALAAAQVAIAAAQADADAAQLQAANAENLANLATLAAAANSFRNVLVNGDFQFDQENSGAAVTITAGAALKYVADQWYAYCTGANITGQRVQQSDNSYRYVLTGAASNTAVGFGQRIEQADTAHLAGGTATLQVLLSSSSITTVTWTAYYANTKDAFGTLASPTRTQIANGTFTINSTEALRSVQISIPSAAKTGIEIVFTTGALTAGNTLKIGNAQLEAGSVASKFERPNAQQGLARCQRYWEKSYDLGVAAGTVTTTGAVLQSYQVGGTVSVSVRHKVDKRAAPTVGTWDRNGNAGSIGTFTSGGVFTSRGATISLQGNSGFIASVNTTDALGEIHYTSNARM